MGQDHSQGLYLSPQEMLNWKVLTGRKTDVVGVVGFRTDGIYLLWQALTRPGTDNDMSSEEAYHNIMVLLPIQQ
jgi:hypothetical protein